MATQHFMFSLLTTQSPQKVFEAITHVREWWSGYYEEEIIGEAAKLHDEFSFSAGDGVHYSKHKLVEVIPGKRMVWLTTHSDFNYLEKKDEWTGTRVIFDISTEGDQTRLVFTHEGLTPEVECYNACSPAWTQYLQNKLLPLINKN